MKINEIVGNSSTTKRKQEENDGFTFKQKTNDKKQLYHLEFLWSENSSSEKFSSVKSSSKIVLRSECQSRCAGGSRWETHLDFSVSLDFKPMGLHLDDHRAPVDILQHLGVLGTISWVIA
jgi:hypothetical protein